MPRRRGLRPRLLAAVVRWNATLAFAAERQVVIQTGRAMSSNQLTEIFVELLEEGTACWRPVRAIPLGEAAFRIAADQEIPTEEKWAFSPGEAVTCEPREFQNGVKGLVATKRLGAG